MIFHDQVEQVRITSREDRQSRYIHREDCLSRSDAPLSATGQHAPLPPDSTLMNRKAF